MGVSPGSRGSAAAACASRKIAACSECTSVAASSEARSASSSEAVALVPAPEDTLMMRPPSRSSGRKLSVTAITPATLTLSVGSTMLERSQPSRSSRTPALLTSASSGLLAEHEAATAEAAAATVALFVTSSSTGTTCTLPQLSVAASAAPLCVSRQPRNKTCSPPRAEMASAIARPMPRVAPVTKTRIDTASHLSHVANQPSANRARECRGGNKRTKACR